VISYIAVSPTDPKHLWITLSGYADGMKVLESKNGFGSWNNCSGSLPNVPANCILYSKSPAGLFVGTDLGVYFLATSGGTKDWVRYGQGLPNVVVNDLQLTPDGKLWAATFGRGLWALDVGRPGK
jgi:ligand-binding sensor domain-containing protein